MLIGTMNHPARPVIREIEWMAELGFEFVDLTLEPPAAAFGKSTLKKSPGFWPTTICKSWAHRVLSALCSPLKAFAKPRCRSSKHCIKAFAQLGAEWMNIHTDRNVPMHDRKWIIERNIQSLRELLPWPNNAASVNDEQPAGGIQHAWRNGPAPRSASQPWAASGYWHAI